MSATLLSANDVFSRVHPILAARRTPFKVPAHLELLAALNTGLREFSQIGKFLTVYPRNETEAVDLARKLHLATRGLTGPKIPFDARYRKRSLVYYRYGSFAVSHRNGDTHYIIDNNGRARPDVRNRSSATPKWLRDPFQRKRPAAKQIRVADRIGIDLLPIKTLARRGKGGVYQAVDLSGSPVRQVVLKQGRRNGEVDWASEDGFLRIKREARILRRLNRAGVPVPAVLDEFAESENRYLILEMANGRPLLGRNRQQPTKYSWRNASGVLNRLEPILRSIHGAGYVWRDCKPEHIFITRKKTCLIDFEGACRISETAVLPWGSPAYLPPCYRKKFATRCAGTLEDDYALGVIAFQFLSGMFPSASPHQRANIYIRTKCPSHLRARIESLLHPRRDPA